MWKRSKGSEALNRKHVFDNKILDVHWNKSDEIVEQEQRVSKLNSYDR